MSAHPRSTPARDLALIATFAGIMAALGTIPAFYPAGIPVPITAQSLGVMLAGAILGRRRGAASIVLFLALVAVGLPLLAGGRGGLAVFTGPSAGYLFGYPVAAFVVGAIVERFNTRYQLAVGVAANLIGGVVVLYAIGVPVTAWRAHIALTTAISAAGWYLVGDTAKAFIAGFVARGVHAAYPGLLGTPRRTAEPRRDTADID